MISGYGTHPDLQSCLVAKRAKEKRGKLENIHLRNLLTHTLLFWHFLENFNFEFKKNWNTLQ